MVKKDSAQPAAPRGRPRSFDTDQVLDRSRHPLALRLCRHLDRPARGHDRSPQAEPLRSVRRQEELYLAALDDYLADIAPSSPRPSRPRPVRVCSPRLTQSSIDKFIGKDKVGTGCFMMHPAIRRRRRSGNLRGGVREFDGYRSIAHWSAASRRRSRPARSLRGQPPRPGDGDGRHHYGFPAGHGRVMPRQELQALADPAITLVKAMAGVPA